MSVAHLDSLMEIFRGFKKPLKNNGRFKRGVLRKGFRTYLVYNFLSESWEAEERVRSGWNLIVPRAKVYEFLKSY